jgi:predicted anti-sigma-YlaC factor YlaD
MIAPNPNLLCRQAKLYYYDFLWDESSEVIPQSIVDHIERCQHCREQIDQLEVVLSEVDGLEPEQQQVGSAIIHMLKLHFAYIGRPITCKTVRPFLPSLLDPALEIRIPTPITTHLDNCPQCSEDLETIRGLNLNRKQLRRLSQLFAERTAEDNVSCSQARAAILAVATMALRETSAEVLKHLCTCPDCRKLLYQYRETVHKELFHAETIQNKFPCEEVSATDIFDYVIPYGIDPSDDQYAKFRKSFTSHAAGCPKCLGKMQQLHNTVYEIAERPESDAVTIYRIDESAKVQALSETDNLYAGFPIRVEIASREDEVMADVSAPIDDYGATLKQKATEMNFRPLPLFKTAVAAAAVILIGVALFLSTPTARAVTINEIYKAIEKVKNVYIARFNADETGPAQETWVSRTSNICMSKTGRQLVLWDIPNGVRKSKQLNAAVTETFGLTKEMVADVETKMSGSLGLMPFYDISDIPADAEWSRISDESLKATAKDTEVYDLTWVEKRYDGSIKLKKWRIFVDPKTNLPQRAEFYEKLPADKEYTLESVRVVEYLSDNEIQAVIKDSSF